MTQYANVPGQHNIIVQVVGDGNTIVPNHAHLTLTRYLTRRGRTKSEADLLSPYAMAIPMLGREVQMAEFRRWLTTSQPIAIRVLVGQAGSGKTRLALELCEAMIADNWDAGFVTDRELVRFLEQQNLSAWGWQRPTLVVVDAAATRARLLHDWLVELADHVGDLERPLRLLFIERHADPTVGWWEWAFGRGGEDARAIQSLLDPPDRPIALPALVGTEARRAILLATLERVGSAVRPPALGDDPHFDQQLATLTWGGEPLFLMMAGLTAAHVGIGHVLALARTDLAFHIAENEIDRIERIAAERRVPAAFLSHMAAYETLCQGLSRPMLEAVIDEEKTALRRPSAGDAPEIAEALYAALPGEEGGIIPVLPPMIGEAVVLRVLGRLTGEGQCAAVSRAARHARECVAATVVHLVQDYVQAGHSAPLAWLDDLIQKHATDHKALIEIIDQFPEKTVALRERAATIMVLIVQIMRELPIFTESEVTEAVVTKATRFIFTFVASLNNLGSWLGQLGRHQEALTALQEAVEIRRMLAIDAKGFDPALANSLSNLSNCLSLMGRRKEALAAIQEAVGLYRELAAIGSEAFRPALSVVLSNLSHCLSVLGYQDEALAAAQEAVEIRRTLAAVDPKGFRPALADSLNNLSNCLSMMRHRKEALAAIQEAVGLYRELAAIDPEAIRPDLAMSLQSLGHCLSDMEYRKEALAVMQEAVGLYRELAASNPEVVRPQLAGALYNLSSSLKKMEYREEALAVIQEAVEIRRALAATDPEAFGPELASSLNNLSNLLSALGHQEEALAVIQEAVEIRRALATTDPEASRPELAVSLYNLGSRFSALGHWEEALIAVEEAITTLAPDFLAKPEAFMRSMSMMVEDYSRTLAGFGRAPDIALLYSIVEVLWTHPAGWGCKPKA